MLARNNPSKHGKGVHNADSYKTKTAGISEMNFSRYKKADVSIQMGTIMAAIAIEMKNNYFRVLTY